MIRRLRSAAPVRLIPFLNTLGHLEGFVRSEGGQWLAEGPSTPGNEQICATRPECAAFARDLVVDALDAFDDEWMHLGGDETRQLGQCPACAARVAEIGAAGLYAEYYAPLCRFVLERGRRPALWADVLLNHPEALALLPRSTLLFDWQYSSRPGPTTARLRQAGFDVVCCPLVHTAVAGWCHLAATQQNVDEHAADAAAQGALGVLVTTWEFFHFSDVFAALPVIYAAGRRLARGADWDVALEAEGGAGYAAAADLLGNRVPATAALLAPGQWRLLRERLVIRQNPFSLWQAWRGEVCGPPGDVILELCDAARERLPAQHPLNGPLNLHSAAVMWVREVERAAQAYARRAADETDAYLTSAAQALAALRPWLQSVATRGGSSADVTRLEVLLQKVEVARMRIRALLPGAPQRPAFAVLVQDGYVPGDQIARESAAFRT
jgi:hypothetical protein